MASVSQPPVNWESAGFAQTWLESETTGPRTGGTFGKSELSLSSPLAPPISTDQPLGMRTSPGKLIGALGGRLMPKSITSSKPRRYLDVTVAAACSQSSMANSIAPAGQPSEF